MGGGGPSRGRNCSVPLICGSGDDDTEVGTPLAEIPSPSCSLLPPIWPKPPGVVEALDRRPGMLAPLSASDTVGAAQDVLAEPLFNINEL
jgi:hypothetical protein